jgi:CheY-like chemotaxis protein
VIINDILDFSKITARKLDIHETPFDIRHLFGETIEPLAVLAREKGISLVFDIHTDVPDSVMGDRGRLRQILNNLIGNALKFTEEGVVCVKLEAVSHNQEEAILHFQVTDTGIGIPEEAQEHIFESFSQADGSATRRFGGTGLGLAIASELVEMMGGKLMLDSAPGQGSTFHFTIPMKLAAQASREKAPPPEGAPLQETVMPLGILLAEDNETNQKIAKAMLNKMGHEVTIVENGKDAVAKSLEGGFDIILMDVMMPKMDGLEATRLIREKEFSTGEHIPIIALTAKAMPEDRDKCIEAGMDDYISKPMRTRELIEKLMLAIPVKKRQEL